MKIRILKHQKEVMKMLKKEGMIESEQQIIDIALFDYFQKRDWFSLSKEYWKKIKKTKGTKK